MPMLATKIFLLLLTISSIQARCPAGDSVKIYGHSGIVTAKSGYTRRDKCEWKIFAPRQKRSHKISVTISKITCTKNLVIEGEDFCQHKPRITRTYIPNSCKEDCRQSSCRKIKGYPLIITYGKYADDNGFVIRFTYEPCGTTPTASAGDRKTTSTRRPTETPLPIATATQTTFTSTGTGFNVTFSPKSLHKNITGNITASEPTIKRSTLSQVSPGSEIPIAVIIAPVVAVGVIVVLLIIIGVKLRKTKQDNEKRKQAESIETMQSYIPTSNVTGAALYETLNKKDTALTYINETYQPLPMDGVGGKYAENKYDTVFQPTATNETATTSESQPSGTHIYEHVEAAAAKAVDTSKICHEYDEVASETDSFDDCSSEDEENHVS